ncbi:polyamine-transporting ATPase 13A3-like isoform X2 [Antedon mediterranea]|uniref:polyamine-transporting ATPase 13A3-like isoform X2 n=1 Tax=Antedon mediterranea TaxID=105859 RepID=UPI003AF893D5
MDDELPLSFSDKDLHGYQKSDLKTCICYILGILSAGLLFLVFYWKPEWKVKAMSTRSSLQDANTIILKDVYQRWHVAQIQYSSTSLPMDNIQLKKTEMKTQVESNQNGTVTSRLQIRFFMYKKLKYIWNDGEKSYHQLRGLDVNTHTGSFYSHYKGFSVNEQKMRKELYGANKINVELRPIPVLFFQEALNPFYVFQVFSVCLWIFAYNYIYFSVAILMMSLVSISLTVYSTRKQSKDLREMVKSSSKVTVCRGGDQFEEVDESNLVPGDVIELPICGCRMSCDAVLISGTCIMNESMLTGESVPIIKTNLPVDRDAAPEKSSIYNSDAHKRHTLFCGTELLQARRSGRDSLLAVVVRTGFSTSKGALVQAILYPRPMDFKLFRDAIRFICVLACLAFIGAIYVVTIKIVHKNSVKDIITKALDVFTIAVPPALPAALTIGMVYAQRRLRALGIFCISPQRINVSGMLDVVCFDKTGTLTEDHLELFGVSPVKTEILMNYFRNHGDVNLNIDNTSFMMIEDATRLPFGPFVVAMATSHSLTRIDGKLHGDPLDLQMFQAVQWHLEDASEDDDTGFSIPVHTIVRPPAHQLNGSVTPWEKDGIKEIGIVRQFPFASDLQRMSVITQKAGSPDMEVYVKGAPEMIASLSDPNTVPEDFYSVLREHTYHGLRVLALAWRPLGERLPWEKLQNLQRDKVECQLRFLGLLIMQNTLKPETTPVIHELNDANIRTIMVTGDNKLTALSVAKKCGMINRNDKILEIEAKPPSKPGEKATIAYYPVHDTSKPSPAHSASVETNSRIESNENIAITICETDSSTDDGCHFIVDGKSFAAIHEHFPELLPRVALKGCVFARMSPDQKTQLVEALQKLDYIVGMCGDGANDCGALKMAHAGISLSEAEASVASPFTSKTPNISCVPTLIKEGRAALVTSFGVFKYMALYSMIQYTTVLILNTIDSFPSDWMFMYWDVAITSIVALLIARNEAFPKIVSKRPQSGLMEPAMLFSLIGHVILQLVFQVGSYLIVKAQPWFVPLVVDKSKVANTKGYESTTVFLVSAFQYIIAAFLFSKGPPFRAPIYTNLLFTISLIVMTLFTIFLLFLPGAEWADNIREFFQMIELSYDHLYFQFIILGIVIFYFILATVLEVYIKGSKLSKRMFTCKSLHGSDDNAHSAMHQEIRKEEPAWPTVTYRPRARTSSMRKETESQL